VASRELIGEDHHAATGDGGVHEAKLDRSPIQVVEQPLAAAEHNRMQPKLVLVD